MEQHHMGIPWEKLTVPSMGSMIHWMRSGLFLAFDVQEQFHVMGEGLYRFAPPADVLQRVFAGGARGGHGTVQNGIRFLLFRHG